MRIEHVAIWTTDLERCKQFYTGYFGAIAGAHYTNPTKGFESCFLRFENGARLEVMTTTTLSLVEMVPGAQRLGLAHLAISVGSERLVDKARWQNARRNSSLRRRSLTQYRST
jgi:lactoylglutathione lyase